jgi:uncharacterized heparinase superfamily protein
VGDSGSLRLAVRASEPVRRPAGFPARLRSLLAGPSWGKKPEARVRYGQPFVPGLAALGRQHLLEARPLLERADAVRGRRFTYLGRTVAFPGRIDWQPHGLPEAWVTALNALDDLEALGVAAALAPTTDVRRRWYETATALLRDWASGVPAGHGIPWRVAALARRIPNLIHAHVFFGIELRADTAQRRALLDTLYAQTTALATAVTGAPPDHTLVAAGRALFMAGRFFDGMEARGWLDKGAALLWTQLREQVHEDGGHRSRSAATHAVVLAYYVEVIAFLLAANDDVPVWARKRVKAMADFLSRLTHPDGEVALFHGAGAEVARPVREVLTAAAIVLHEPGLAPAGDLPGVWPLLVLGESGRRAHAHLPRRAPGAEPRALRRTGYYVLPGEAGDVMLLDGASPPPGGAGGALGYELSAGGLRLLVAPGAGDEEPRWSEYVRSTRSHNVVSVADADQVAGGRVPVVDDVHWVVRDGLLYFTATHDGFARLGNDLRLRQRRHVFCLPGRFWVVCDELIGTGEWEIESFLHLHPDAQVSAVCRGRPAFTVARSHAARLLVVPAHATEVRVQYGVDAPRLQGWHAPRPGERRPAQVLSLAVHERLPALLGYALLPRGEGEAALGFTHDAFRLQATLRTGGREYVLTVVQGDVELLVRTPRA